MKNPLERHSHTGDSTPKPRALLRRALALVALAVAVLFALPASAGELHTTDDAGVFTQGQLATVRSHAQSADFDVRVITTSSYASKSDLGGYVHRFVTAPNLVVIGLDPVHRHVSVHFGTGTRIADGEYKAIESAGISSFKDGDWTAGVVAIVDRAEHAVGTAAGPHSSAAPLRQPASSGGGFGFFWLLVIGGGVAFVIWMIARRARGPAAGGYGPPPGGYGPPVGGYGPGYGPPPGPGYGGGGSGLGSNLASAGLGGLIGYEIGKEVGDRHHHHDDDGSRSYGGRDEPSGGSSNDGGDSAEPGNYDGGGASGGWDDSGGSGGGGGGDSDF